MSLGTIRIAILCALLLPAPPALLARLTPTIDLGRGEQDVTVLGAHAGQFLTWNNSALATGDLDADGTTDLVLGAPRDRGGRVYVVFGPLATGATVDLDHSADVTIVGTSFDSSFGSAVTTADLSGDGIADLVIGSLGTMGSSPSRPAAGAVYALFGPLRPGLADLGATPADVRIYGSDTMDRLGLCVAAGDLNADGRADLAMGAGWADGPSDSRPDGGEAYVLFGPFSPGTTIDLRSGGADVTLYGADADDCFGRFLSAGDISGDGEPDLLLGTFYGDGPGNSRHNGGEAYALFSPLFSGSVLDLRTDRVDVTVYGRDEGDGLGFPVFAADLSGDGEGDLVVAAETADGPLESRPDAGEVYVFLGPFTSGRVIDLATAAPDVTILGADPSGFLGYDAEAGDVNGDGREDLLIGAGCAGGRSGNPVESGEVFVLLGSFTPGMVADLLNGDEDVRVLGAEPGDDMGDAIAVADLNDDGILDITIGAPSADGPGNSRTDCGEAYVLFGGPLDTANRPPECDAGGPYAIPCVPSPPCQFTGPAYDVDLDGSRSSDPDGDPLTFDWFVSCGSLAFGPFAGSKPRVCMPLQCDRPCIASLEVRDGRGGSASCRAEVALVDDVPPVVIPPGDLTVECDAVPVPGSPAVSDNCAPNPSIAFVETRTDGNCPGNYMLLRTWTASDGCNAASASQTITVRDTTPPRIEPGTRDLYCLWPPDHRTSCFGKSRFSPAISDNCSPPVAWRFTECLSDQPDDAPVAPLPGWNGDGHTLPDCIVAPDGESLCARAERSGAGPTEEEGRRYAVGITATDACGNESAPVPIGNILVPHDRRTLRKGCGVSR